jgi:arginyl-tRNA synthetase
MKPVIEILEERISAAMAQATGQKALAIVRPATDAKFGDYQANGVMALAKKVQIDPRQLAELIIKTLDINVICEEPEIAGPGFINLRLKREFLEKVVVEIYKHHEMEQYPGGLQIPVSRFGIDKVKDPKTIVVDFSGPNVAKEMHVGHLRSTIIGDCICNMLGFLGHAVIRQNHIGDWGLPFGLLCAYYAKKRTEQGHQGKLLNASETLADIETFYKEAQQLSDENEEFAQEVREAMVGLHSGDQRWISHWSAIISESRKHYEQIYRMLNVGLYDIEDHIRGESFYKDMLPDVVDELKKKKLAVESDGAVCVFPKGFKDKDGKPLPVIVQKSDGAYLYATTDLAAIRYRVNELKADKIIYVTDARQQLHFQMVFAVAKLAGWDVKHMTEDGRRRTEDGRQKTEFVHVTFGSVLGEDGKPLKTREGENVKLKELLDEAVERAHKIVDEKNPDLPEEQKDRIAKAVGIGAVKYSDFSNNRTSDYVFSFDKMLAMDGNTAPYMQYAYARIKSIERKSESKDVDIETELAGISKLNLSEPAELDLAKHLIRYGEAIDSAVGDYRPNYLTSYLYDLAQKFSVFYTDCPVLDASPDKRPTRLLLCDLTAKTIKHGLSALLGIEVVEQM